jgi:hypothetical protein
MSRNDRSPQASAELSALDAILAGEAVSEEHLELAALVASVRGTSPVLDEGGRARLDARIEKLRSARSAGRRHPPRLRPGRIALAGGPLVALLVAVAVVLGSGVLNGSKSTPKLPSGLAPALHAHSAIPKIAPAVGGPATTLAPASGPTSTTGTELSPAAGASAIAPAARGSTNLASNNTNPSNRLVARGASLTLASSPAQLQGVANEVVSSTQRLGGIVESSNVSVHGLSSYASFSLSVPSARLAQLISTLSSLTAVRSLDQSASDITNSYDQASTQLADEKAQRQALTRALAQASTLTQAQTIQQKIAAEDSAIAATTDHVGALLTRGHNAGVSVQIVATSAAAGAGGSGPVKRALNDSLAVLDVALAIALVALAIVLPVGLVALLLFWAASAVRQRARERALATSAAS